MVFWNTLLSKWDLKTCESKIKERVNTNQKQTLIRPERYFSVALFITLYKLVLTFESVDQILNCDHSIQKANELYFGMVPLFTFLSFFYWLIWLFNLWLKMKSEKESATEMNAVEQYLS